MADVNVRMRLRRVRVDWNWLLGTTGPIYMASHRAGTKLADYAKEELVKDGKGYRTGYLYNSIDYRIAVTPQRGIITDVGSLKYEVAYAPFVHDGTPRDAPGTGVIRPKRAKALRFKGADGSTYVRRTVKGQAPNPYLARAIARLKAGDLS